MLQLESSISTFPDKHDRIYRRRKRIGKLQTVHSKKCMIICHEEEGSLNNFDRVRS